MKTSSFTDSQVIAVLKQAGSGTPVPELCREHGISSATFYKYRELELNLRIKPKKRLVHEWPEPLAVQATIN